MLSSTARSCLQDPKQKQLLGELLLPASKAVAAMDVQVQAAEYARISRAAAQAQVRASRKRKGNTVLQNIG